MRSRALHLGGFLLLVGLALVGISLSLFVIFVIYFSEGYEGSWDRVVLGSAWVTFFLGVIAGVVGLASMLVGGLRKVA